MFGQKIRKVEFKNRYEVIPLPIVGYAAATLPEALGALTPILILDTTNRPDIDEYVRIHRNSGSGDVVTQWGRRPDDNTVYQLLLEVIRPVEIKLYFEFKFPDKISLIDHIVQTETICIQPGRSGDKLSETFKKGSRIIMEIPEMGFGAKWNSRLHRFYERDFRKKGFGKKEAILAAENLIKERRILFNYRMKGL